MECNQEYPHAAIQTNILKVLLHVWFQLIVAHLADPASRPVTRHPRSRTWDSRGSHLVAWPSHAPRIFLLLGLPAGSKFLGFDLFFSDSIWWWWWWWWVVEFVIWTVWLVYLCRGAFGVPGVWPQGWIETFRSFLDAFVSLNEEILFVAGIGRARSTILSATVTALRWVVDA
jgi:hypothetical protein